MNAHYYRRHQGSGLAGLGGMGPAWSRPRTADWPTGNANPAWTRAEFPGQGTPAWMQQPQPGASMPPAQPIMPTPMPPPQPSQVPNQIPPSSNPFAPASPGFGPPADPRATQGNSRLAQALMGRRPL